MISLLAALAMILSPAPPPAPLPEGAGEPAPLTWPDLTGRPRPRADATIAYGEDPWQRVDLWRPTGAGPHPVVLMVHGGCWQTAIADRTLMDWACPFYTSPIPRDRTRSRMPPSA